MKKFIAVFLSLVMLFCLTACAKDEKPSQKHRKDDSKVSKEDKLEKYAGQWLDKETATEGESKASGDFVITEIYADCFFAEYIIPMPYKIKINGEISDNWCVGDHVNVKYDNIYRDEETKKIEGDLVSIKESDFEISSDPYVNYKPVIYLYPEKETEVSVSLDLNGCLTCTYPFYDDGWFVTAKPDGTLIDQNGQSYNYLYWEGETYAQWDTSKGFCVKGEDTAEFLEGALEKLGLNRREANEFIVYWLPLMQNNPYNVISFQTEAYINAAKLDINPCPDTLIRVFMTYKATDRFVALEAQELSAPERNGFTVVEWGGTKIK